MESVAHGLDLIFFLLPIIFKCTNKIAINQKNSSVVERCIKMFSKEKLIIEKTVVAESMMIAMEIAITNISLKGQHYCLSWILPEMKNYG